jgi:hypothetical protein
MSRIGWRGAAVEDIRDGGYLIIDLTSGTLLLYLPDKDRVGAKLACLLLQQCYNLYFVWYSAGEADRAELTGALVRRLG